MGDPRKIRKKLNTPRHPWEATRIEHERGLRKIYGARRKRELWKMGSLLAGFKDQTKLLAAGRGAQIEKEKEQLIARLVNLGLLEKGDVALETILKLRVEDVMNRRLQTMLSKKGLARTPRQARQFITHGHVTVNGTVVTSPSYLVLREDNLGFRGSSALQSEEHPERATPKTVDVKTDMGKKKEAPQKETAVADKGDGKKAPEKKGVAKGEKKEMKDEKKETSSAPPSSNPAPSAPTTSPSPTDEKKADEKAEDKNIKEEKDGKE